MKTYMLPAAVAGLLLSPAVVAAEETVSPAGEVAPATTETVPEAKAEKPWLGIVPSATADGIFVDMVQPGTTAEALGLQSQDRILGLHGEKIDSVQDLSRILSTLSVGATLQIEYERNGAVVKTTAPLQAKPEAANDHAEALAIHGPVGIAVSRIERELQAVRDALAKAGMNSPKQDLASAMSSLSQTLDVLPGRLETAAKHFKAVYPEGEFIVNIDITIRSHGEDEVVLDLSPSGAVEEEKSSSSPEKPEADESPETVVP